MEEVPYCIYSGKNSQKVCIHSECNMSPFICNECEDHYCQKLHNHEGGLNIIYLSDLNKLKKKLNNDINEIASIFNLNYNQNISKIFQILQGNLNRISSNYKESVIKHYQKHNFIKKEILATKKKLEQKLCQKLTGKQIKFFYNEISNDQYKEDSIIINELEMQKQRTISLCKQIEQLISNYDDNGDNNHQFVHLKREFIPLKGKIIKKKNIQEQALTYFNQKNYNKAQELYQQILLKNQQNIQANFKLAQISLLNKNFSKANCHLDNVIKIDPTVSQAYYKLGQMYEQQNKNNEAFTYYELALYQEPKNHKYLQKMGDNYAKKQLYQKAQSCYSQILNTQFNIECFRKRSLTYVKLFKIEEAFRDFNILLNKYSNKSEISFQLGKLSQIKGNYEQAITYYTNSITEDPFQIKYYEYRGAANLKCGKYKLAIEDFIKFLQINLNAQIYYLKAKALIQIGQQQQAYQDINMANDIESNYRYLELKAQIQESLNMKDQAQRTMQLANLQKLSQRLKQL